LSNKELIQNVIASFEQNAENIPPSLSATFKQIKQKLHDFSDKDIKHETATAVTSPASEQPYKPDKLSYLLYEAFPEMERMARTAANNQYELLQATNQLRGELGMATDPPFPE
jgi:hypothetical protein